MCSDLHQFMSESYEFMRKQELKCICVISGGRSGVREQRTGSRCQAEQVNCSSFLVTGLTLILANQDVGIRSDI